MSINPLHDWVNLPDRVIADGRDLEGNSLLKLFLIEYVRLTNEDINPSCPSCLASYIKKYKKLNSMNTTTSDYELQKEYNGIPLEFGSGIYVTNDNITNEYGEKLKERFAKLGTAPEIIFTKFPKVEAEKEQKPTIPLIPETPVVKETKTEAPAKPAKLADVLKEQKQEVVKTEELTAEQLEQALNLEVVEPTILNKDDVEDLEA